MKKFIFVLLSATAYVAVSLMSLNLTASLVFVSLFIFGLFQLKQQKN